MKTEPKTPSAWGIELSKLWIESDQGFPVNVKLLAIEVTKKRYPEDPIGIIRPHGIPGIDGMLSKRKNKGDWCISYDETVSVSGRINFTLGHEFGHYLLHRHTNDEFCCTQSGMLDYNNETAKKMEAEANKFASFLLMPADDFRKQIGEQEVTISLLEQCAARYNTSLTATALKWLEITDEAAMLVVARDDFICWSYPSQLAKHKRTYLSPGTPLPQSVIDRLNSTVTKSGEVCRISSGVWHQTMEAEEFVVISDRFDCAIFLIKFPVADIVEHEEETEEDTFTLLQDRAQGLSWKK